MATTPEKTVETTAAEARTVPLLAQRLRRYCFAYTASHDPAVCDDIMVEDYTLRMGNFVIRGRDEHYKPAAEKQYRQFPGLGMAVHQLLVTPHRAALHFTEYGRSVLTDTVAAWSGISLYHWDGDQLTDCRVEQDYWSRRRQLRTGRPNPVEAPGYDPWSAPLERAEPAVETVTRQWLADGGLGELAVGAQDDEHAAPVDRVVLDRPEVAVLDCFAGTHRAAFHATASGTVSAWPGGGVAASDVLGRRATVYYSGIAQVRDGAVVSARVVSDRLAVERRLASEAR